MWKDIKGYEGLYQINEIGEVIRNNKKLKVRVSKKGYGRVHLSKNNKAKDFYIHRLVAETFMVNTENKPQVNHIDGNKLNNLLSNLEWNTNSENQKHSFKVLGRIPKNNLTNENRNKNQYRNKITGKYEKNTNRDVVGILNKSNNL